MDTKGLKIFLVICCVMQIQCQIINSTGLLSGCAKTKGCFVQPSGCSANCKLVGTWVDQGDNVTFELVGKADGWVAVGFNDQPQMAGGEAFVCLKSNELRHYTLPGHSATPSGKTSGFKYLSGSNVNGYVRCTFMRTKNPGNGMKDLNKQWYLLFALGSVSTGIQQHAHESRYTTSKTVDLSLTEEVDSAKKTIDVLLKAHGCVMCVAWLGLAVVGMFFARYMKTAFGEELILGLKAWFQFHRGLMLFTVVLTIVGGILIFQEQDWEMEDGAHPIIGLIVIILACLQPLFALLRPPPNDEKRWLFNWGHRTIGAVTLILAVVAIFLGINMDEMNLGAAQNATIAVYLALAVMLAIGLEVYDHLFKNRQQEHVLHDTATDEVKMDHMQLKETSKTGMLHKIVLVILSVLSVVAVLASVIFIATAEPGEEGGGDEPDSDDE